MTRACFFDFDGTLFDTRADLAATVNHMRRELGLSELSLAEVLVNVGRGARYLLAHSIPEADRPFEDLWPIFSRHYAEHCCEALTPYPGVAETLEELLRRGWKLGINTNKPNFAVARILERFGFGHFFGPGVVAGGDCATLKPSAEPLRLCAAKLNHVVTPGDWMVGDSWADLGCAQNAGVQGAYCKFGFSERRDFPAVAVLERFSDLLDFTPPLA